MVVYRLGDGPFLFQFVRVDLGEGVELEQVRFVGATRVIGTLPSDAVQVLFPAGRDAQLSGVPILRRMVVINPPGVRFDALIRVEGTGVTITARGRAFAGLLGAGVRSSRLLTVGRPAVVMNESPTSRGLRLSLEGYFRLLERREELALDPQNVLRARQDMLEMVRMTLLPQPSPGDVELKAPRPRRRALAIAVEEWLWRKVDDPDAPPVSLGAVAAEFGVSIRSIQLAVEESFGVSFVRFARLARLHQVHAALVHGVDTNVSEVATRYGFWHLGRFSLYYREVFGQRPSETARGAHRQPPMTPATRRSLMRRALEAARADEGTGSPAPRATRPS
jgi:AraC-like DNA-binding protein